MGGRDGTEKLIRRLTRRTGDCLDMGNKGGGGVSNVSQVSGKAARENDLEGKMLNSGRFKLSQLISQVDLK